MRKLIAIGALGVAVLVTWNAETEACRHRHRRGSAVCYVPSCPSVEVSPAPRRGASPLAALRANVTSTRQFVSPKGRTYTIHRTTFMDTHEEAQVPAAPLTAAAGSGDRFGGTDRKAAKTSIGTGTVEPFDDIAAIRDMFTMMQLGDDVMSNDPLISKAADNQRVDAEQRNVRVRGLLYAAAKEKDNDFHLIVGTDDASNTDAMMNTEISGLPGPGPFLAPLTAVRDQFKAHFGSNLPGRTYDIFDPPIPVEVTGSLFFDIDHKGGTVGPGPMKPSSAWEIHPITKIVFEP